MIKTFLATFLLVVSAASQLQSKLLINELVTGTPSDWVELKYTGTGNEKLEISSLFVTMYYGTNQQLADEPVTIYSYDREETPYDDRFVVVHLTEPGIPDETDRTGDTNHNGYIDLYCSNYYGSLWNSDGVAAIDSDDTPDNNGILDFVAYSSRDGEANTTIESYAHAASAAGEWTGCSETGFQDCSVYTGPDGLESYQSLSRRSDSDTNSADDFAVTRFQTPGRENQLESPASGKKIFSILKKKITIIPSHPEKNSGTVPLNINSQCNIKFRVFSVTGVLIYQSPLFRSVNPGSYSVTWFPLRSRRNIPTGLYIGELTAVSTRLRRSQRNTLFFVVSRYR